MSKPAGGEKSDPTVPGPPPQPTLPAVRRMLLERLWRAVACCPHCGAHLRPALPEKVPR